MYGTLPTGKLLHYTATLLDLYNHNLITYPFQGQGDPGAVQLSRRFERVSVRSYIEVKMWNLQSTKVGIKRTAALVTTLT